MDSIIAMSMPFVIHLHRRDDDEHYDLMLAPPSAGADDANAPLATWRLPDDPAGLAEDASMPAARIQDHGRHFLTYEGPLRQDRGEVRIVHRGRYEAEQAGHEQWVFSMRGSRLRGRFQLRHAGGDAWRLTRLRRAAPA